MKNWFETLIGTTRGRLLSLLRRSERSVGDLASELGISGNAVRGHVAGLQRDGLVEPAGVERETGGKPASLYRLTADAEELFPKAYAYVLSGLVGLLEERLGRGGVESLLEEVGRRAGADRAAVDGAVAGKRGGSREGVERAAAALRALGGDIDVVAMEGGWRLVGHGCPLSSAVGEHAAVCAVVRAIVAELGGGDVRECCDHGPRPSCCFEVLAERA